MKTFLSKAARPIEILLGLVFLGGALLKSGLMIEGSNMDLFARQISGYGIFEARPMLESAALFALTIEMLLGAALLLALRRSMLSLAVMQTLLLGFTGLILYGWIFHDLEDCGCLGAIKMTPPVSIGKNIILMALGALAWVGFARQGEAARKWPTAAVPRTLVALLVTAATVLYAHNDLQQVAEALQKAQQAGPYTKYVFVTEEGSFDLGKGEHIVAVLNMDCEHCIAAVPDINDLAADPNLPEVVALCYEPTAGSMDTFRAFASPEFPMHSMGDNIDEFMLLLEGVPPQISFVKDGQQIRFWEGRAPTIAELTEAIAAQ